MIQLLIPAVIAIGAFTGAWQIQANRYERQLADLKTEYAQAQVRAVEKANAETIRLQARSDEAQRVARQRQSSLAADAARTRDALAGLSDATDAALRRASDSHSACQSNARQIAYVFGRCAGQLKDVAADADGWRSEAMTLRDAWPK